MIRRWLRFLFGNSRCKHCDRNALAWVKIYVKLECEHYTIRRLTAELRQSRKALAAAVAAGVPTKVTAGD